MAQDAGTSAQAASVAPSAAEIAKAKALFEAGGRAYDAGDFETAIQAFEQAYKIVRREGLLFSLAQAHRRQFTVGSERVHLERAIALYRQYLAEVSSGGRRAEATKALGELEALAGRAAAQPGEVAAQPTPERVAPTRLALSTAVEGATISIDGAAPRVSPFSVQVEPGPHRVVVSAPGYRSKELVLVAIEGELVPASNIELEEEPARVVVVTDAGASISVDGRFVGEAPLSRPLELASGHRFIAVTRAGHRTRTVELELGRGRSERLDLNLSTTTQRDFAFAGAIGSGVLLAGGGVLGGLAFVRQARAREIYEIPRTEGRPLQPSERDEYLSLRAERDRLVAGATTVAGLGAVVGVVSLGLFAFDEPAPVLAPDEPRKNRPGGAPTPEPEAPSLEIGLVPVLGVESAYLGVVGRF
jgi:hypothetical protein